MNDKTRPNIVVVTAITAGIIGGFVVSWNLFRSTVIGIIGPSVLFLSLILGWIIIPSLGIFIPLITKGNYWRIFKSGFTLGIKIAFISIIVQLFFVVLTFGISWASGETIANPDWFVNVIPNYIYALIGGNLVMWGLLVGGEGVIAFDALKFVTSLTKNKATEWLEKSDWRSSVISLFVIAVFSLSLFEAYLLPDLFTFLFTHQPVEGYAFWIALFLLMEIISLWLFALSITIENLLEKQQSTRFWYKIVFVFGGLTLLFAIAQRLANAISNIEYLEIKRHWVDLIPGEVLLFSVFILLVILWVPRHLIKLPQKHHVKILNFAIWSRVLLIPLCAYIVIDLMSPYSVQSNTRTWTILVSGIVGVYYLYVGIFRVFSNKPGFQAWVKKRSITFSAIKTDSKEKHTRSTVSVVDSWLKRISETSWWNKLKLPQNPSIKILGLGFSSWLLSKLLDSVFEWIIQSTIIPLFMSK